MDFFRLLRTGEPSVPPEQVLAYLEEAHLAHAPCLVVDIKASETPATLTEVGPGGVGLAVAGAAVLRKGGPVRLRLFLDGLRIEARATVAAYAGGDLRLTLPHALALDERRSRPRALLGERDNAHATLLTGLFEGKSLYGLIENLSMGGLRVQVLQAASVARKTAIPLVGDIVLPGESFALVRLEDLFRCPALELPGHVVYHQTRLGKLSLGVAFEPGFDERLAPLREWLDARTEPIPRTLPRKERAAAERAVAEKVPEPPPPVPERPRKVLRLAAGPDYRLAFQVADVRVEGLFLAELTAFGCTWVMDPVRAGRLAPGRLLEGFVIQHRDLPAAELTAKMVRLDPAAPPAEPGDLRVEAEFVDLDPRVRHLIDRHIRRNLGPLRAEVPEPAPAAVRVLPGLQVPAGWTVRFRHQGIGYHSVPLVVLSAQGCTVLATREEARELVPGALLALFRFDQADLPPIPLQAQVVRCQAREQDVLLDVAFVNLNERVRSTLHGYVLDRIGCQPGDPGDPAPGPVADSLLVDLADGYHCRFRVNGVAYQDQPLSGLLPGSCRFGVDVRRSGPFQAGALLQTFYVDHPELPQVPVQACVSRVVGKLPGRTEGQVTVYADFINLNQRLRGLIQEHLLSIMKGDE
jgi:hypothetical protein